MKAYELMSLVQKDLDSYRSKKYKVTRGRLVNLNGASYVDDFEISFYGEFKKDDYVLFISNYTEVEEIKQSVSWKEAEKAGLDGKKIKYDNWDDYYSIKHYYNLFSAVSIGAVKEFISGKWYIED